MRAHPKALAEAMAVEIRMMPRCLIFVQISNNRRFLVRVDKILNQIETRHGRMLLYKQLSLF